MFACEQAGITPDFLVLSKALTGGYLPMAAVLTTDQVYGAFYDDYATLRAFLHSHTYTGNPLACAAALATLAWSARRLPWYKVRGDEEALRVLLLASPSHHSISEPMGETAMGMCAAITISWFLAWPSANSACSQAQALSGVASCQCCQAA